MAMCKNTFDDVMRYSHTANLNKLNKGDPFWKVALLFQSINDMATKCVERAEFVIMDESLIRCFGFTQSVGPGDQK